MNQFRKLILNASPKHIRALIGIAGAAFFLGLFLKLTSEIFESNELLSLDRSILIWFADHRFQTLNGMAIDLTSFGSVTGLTLLSLTVLMGLWFAKDFLAFTYLALASSVAGLATASLKNFFGRERPQVVSHLVDVHSASYPSGHSLASTSIYFAFAILACRRFKTKSTRSIILSSAFFLICFIGISRIYLGVHYPSDVASGFFLGISWILFLTAIFSRQGL